MCGIVYTFFKKKSDHPVSEYAESIVNRQDCLVYKNKILSYENSDQHATATTSQIVETLQAAAEVGCNKG